MTTETTADPISNRPAIDKRKGAKSASPRSKGYDAKRRNRWIKRIVGEFLRLQGYFPWKDFLPEENCPKWVWHVEQEYAQVTFSLANPKRVEKLTVCGLGSFLGYQCAYAVWMTENIEALGKKIEEAVEKPENAEKFEKLASNKAAVDEGIKFLRKYIGWYGAMRRMAGRALKSCVYQSYDDMTGFLVSFGRAFSRKPKIGAGTGDFGSTNFGIYHFMISNWKTVDGLGSVRELHELLRERLGEHKTGGLKRVEKICQRVHLHYRKPGRPKERNNSDT
jgi:hypothetical protein